MAEDYLLALGFVLGGLTALYQLYQWVQPYL